MFERWGRLVYRYRWTTLVLSALLLVASIVLLAQGGTLRNTSLKQGEAIRASNMMGAELPQVAGGTSFDIIFGSSALPASDPRFQRAVLAALAPLRADRRVSGIQTPYGLPLALSRERLSRDGKHVLATVSLKDDYGTVRHYFGGLRALVHSDTLQVTAVGDVLISHDYDTYLASDLQRAERVSLPLALLLLLLVFGSVVAALLPLGVSMLAVVGGLAGVYLLTRVADVSQYALNVVTLIGLGVAIDYSLFIVSRFREELARGATVEESLARALATSGRAIAFSGLTVAIGLAGLLFYQGTVLPSMGLAGTIVVGLAVFYGLTFLPALLAVLGRRVNTAQLPLRRSMDSSGLWQRLAAWVMRRPVWILVVTLPLLLAAGSPFLSLRLAGGTVTGLPPQAESQRGYHLLAVQFPSRNLTGIAVVIYYPTGRPLAGSHVGALYDLNRRIAGLSDVLRVEGIFSPGSGLTRTRYLELYTGPVSRLPAQAREALQQTVGTHIVTLVALTEQAAESDQARAIVRAIRRMRIGDGGQILVTGETAFDMDAIDQILADTPYAMAFIMVMTYLVLFLLLGSVILPLKAVLTDVLSISASFGALVWIFQQGHFSKILNFTPSSIDPTVPVLLFCIVFGLSMDYEVFLLSRMKEAYDRGVDNRHAVAEGLERSGRLVTGAALIMVVVFLAFGLADVIFIKAIGLGMAIAVAIDATIIRALVVPAIMRLLGDLNWWAPHPLAELHRRLNLGESGAGPEAAAESVGK